MCGCGCGCRRTEAVRVEAQRAVEERILDYLTGPYAHHSSKYDETRHERGGQHDDDDA